MIRPIGGRPREWVPICWTSAWHMRRAMMSAFRAPTFETNCFDTLFETVSDPGSEAAASEPAVAVLDLELRHVACSKRYAALVGEDATQLTGVSLRSIVRDRGAVDEAISPVLRGEIDFRSVELEVIADDTRLALHVGMVRRDDATPRGVVLVAHPVPAPATG